VPVVPRRDLDHPALGAEDPPVLHHHRRARRDVERLGDRRVGRRRPGADLRDADLHPVLLEVGERPAALGRGDVRGPGQAQVGREVRRPQDDGLRRLGQPLPQHHVGALRQAELGRDGRRRGQRLPRQVAVEHPGGRRVGALLGDGPQVVELVHQHLRAGAGADPLVAADQPLGHQQGQRLAHHVPPDRELGRDAVLRGQPGLVERAADDPRAEHVAHEARPVRTPRQVAGHAGMLPRRRAAGRQGGTGRTSHDRPRRG